jgi:hypothetical protein
MSATANTSATKSKTKSKKASSAKTAANRRNAEKSVGPKTPEGKAKSRFNALKHGMTAQTVLLPGDDTEAFTKRLRYLQDDLQPRNSLEGVVIERLAGDLWKADRAEQSAGARINFRLRHGPVDQARKDRDEAIELGQHLLWQPAFPLPVGLHEGEAKGALAKFPLADAPGDPMHPARLLLKLEATVAGCDWLLKRWEELRFRLEIPGTWDMADVWKMVRLMGKTALEVKDDFQVALLVLASLALEPAPEPDPGRKSKFADVMSAMSRDDRLSRVVAGVTRLCEPFQQALARMPLDKLAPENEEQARQRLFAVVDQELGRIGRIRAMLQKFADADEAEAPVRLAFETGTEGDRGRRYVLAYERLVNRRIDTFLKVRKASITGELDLVALEQSIGTAELAKLVAAADLTVPPDPGDLRSGDGRGREALAQQPRDPFPTVSPGSARVSDPATRLSSPKSETPDRRSPLLGSSADQATARHLEPRPTETCGCVPGPGSETLAQQGDPAGQSTHQEDATPDAMPADILVEVVAANDCPENECDDNLILRNEATAASDDVGGWGRHTEGEAPNSEACAPGAVGTAQFDPSDPPSEVSQCDDLALSQRDQGNSAPHERQDLESDGAIGPAAPVVSGERKELAAENLDSRPNGVNEPARADEGHPRGDEQKVQCAAEPPPVDARLAKLLVPMDRAALALLTDAELKARRWALYQAKRKLERRR